MNFEIVPYSRDHEGSESPKQGNACYCHNVEIRTDCSFAAWRIQLLDGRHKIKLLDYIEQERQGYINRGSTSYAQNLGSLYSHLKAFAGPNKKLASVDKRFIQNL